MAPGAFGRQVKQPVRTFGPGHADGLEGREDGAQGLADACGRLRQQAQSLARGPPDRFGQATLAPAHCRSRKDQLLQRLGPLALMAQFLFGPGCENHALLDKKVLQGIGLAGAQQHRLLLVVEVEVDQCQFELGQTLELTQQMPIDLGLCPMQGLLLRRDRAKAPPVGLDLLQPLQRAVIAVGTAAHLQRPPLPAQAELALVVGAAPASHQGMTGHAFLGAGRCTKAQVQIAPASGEFA